MYVIYVSRNTQLNSLQAVAYCNWRYRNGKAAVCATESGGDLEAARPRVDRYIRCEDPGGWPVP